MKVLIIYYSQTGNTQKIARSIRDGVRAAGHDVFVCALRDVRYEMLEDYDLIGIGSPVWCADPPVLRRFIEGLPPQNGKLAFSFCTHGTMPSLYFPVVVLNLTRRGFAVIDWRDWYGDCTIQVFPSPYFTAGHPDETDLRKAAAFGTALCAKAEAILAGDRALIPPLPVPDIPSPQAAAVTNLLSSDRVNPHCNLRRDEAKCLYPACHICQDNCPMGYIDLEKGRYGKHGDSCGDGHGCTYCELLCPMGAIYPDPPYELAAPVGQAEDFTMFRAILDQAEREGRFRKLIDDSQVGVATPYYSTNPKHPRLRPLSTKEDNA